MPSSSTKQRKRSRLKLSADNYKVLVNAVYDRDGWRCVSCTRRDGLSAHHIIYRSQGGDDALDNLVSLCTNCHRAVHNKNLSISRSDSGGVVFIPRNDWRTYDVVK